MTTLLTKLARLYVTKPQESRLYVTRPPKDLKNPSSNAKKLE